MTAVQEPIEVYGYASADVVRIGVDVDATVAGELRDKLADAVERHASVVVDLSGAQTVDPAGLGVLIRAHRLARQRGGWLCLAAPSRFVVTVLHTMHVDSVFPIFDDTPSALDWLRGDNRDT